MSNFNAAFDELFEFEGVYSNDKDDRGGETKFGISKRAYPHLDIASLTKEKAKSIYRRDYWDPLHLDLIKDDHLASEIFEQAVNMGPGRAVSNCQKALNYLGSDLNEDGRMGQLTVQAINNYKYPKDLLKALNAIQFCTYLDIVRNNPTQKRFARGWLARITIPA